MHIEKSNPKEIKKKRNHSLFFGRIFFSLFFPGFFCAAPLTWIKTEFPGECVMDVAKGGNKVIMITNDEYFRGALEVSALDSDWTTVPISAMNIKKIKWENSQYIISFNKYSEDKTSFMISADGTIWSQVTDSIDLNYIQDFIWDGTRYLAGGETGIIAVSADLSSWTKHPLSPADLKFDKLFYLNNIYFGLGSVSGKPPLLYTSFDGLNWTRVPYFQDKSVYDAIYANEQYLVTGAGGGVYVSPDAVTWTSKPVLLGPDFTSVSWNGKNYVFTAVRGSILEVWNSQNLVLWKSYPVDDGSRPLNFDPYIPVWRFTSNIAIQDKTWVTGYSSVNIYDSCNGFVMESSIF